MIGAGRLCEIGQVAAGAIHGSASKPSVDVASHALDANVSAAQAELGCVVVEGRALPGGRGMTTAAIVREARGQVIRIFRRDKCLRVAAVALRGSTLETVPGVTRRARQLSVCARQAEVRKLRVVEFGALPMIHAMARIACHRKICRHMIYRTGLLEITLVAANACCTQSDELTAGGSCMTRIALQCGMRTQ